MSASWRPDVVLTDTVTLLTADPGQQGTDFPYGCRWCGRSTSSDGVEVCELLGGLVHADCHDRECFNIPCAYLLCTEDRCIDLSECDDCLAPRCLTHGVHSLCF